MSDDPQWHRLDTYETRKFIEDVTDPNFAELFDGPAYELWTKNLRFFDGYEHYMLANKSVIPHFTLEYISNGENHYFLDGSEHPLELLIQKGALRLTEGNVLTYLDFHSDVAFYPYRKVKFITDPTNTPYSGASAMGHHFKTLKYHAKLELKESADDACFYITMPVLYNGETIKGRVQVLKTGEINILEPINVPLMDKTRDHNPLDYDHMHEKELLAQNMEVLLHSDEAKRMYETVQSYGCKIRFVSGVGGAAFVPNAKTAFIVAPENLETYSPYQVIALAGSLRDLEHHLMKEIRGDPFDDQNLYLERNMALNLDILRKICIIVDELCEAGFDEILRKFKKAGFESFYSGYKNDVSEEELVRILGRHFDIKVVE